MSKVSPAQRRALAWLSEHGGRASIDPYGRAVAKGARSQSAPQTWLRLFISGHVCQHMIAGHMGITMSGVEAAKK